MVTGQRTNNLAAELSARGHRFIAGVQTKDGGQDEGPGPHELLEAALAACTIITLQMYANRKHMKLESTDVSVSVVTEGRQESSLLRKIRLRGELNDEEKKSLIEIANKCPIHKLLSSHIVISTELD